jgi:hypothetical protein
MIFLSQLLYLLLIACAHIMHLLLSVHLQRLMRYFEQLQLPLTFIIAVRGLLQACRFLRDFEAVFRFNVFLEAHAEDVYVDWKLEFGG